VRLLRLKSLLAWRTLKECCDLDASDFVEWEPDAAAVEAELARIGREAMSALEQYAISFPFICPGKPPPGPDEDGGPFCPPDSVPKPWPIVYVSHRWIAQDHPDPDGGQLRELQSRLGELLRQEPALGDWLVFLDYASLPQKPRSADDDAVFRRGLGILGTLLVCAGRVVVLSDGYADYLNRSWCFFEAVVGQRKLRFFPDQGTIREELQRHLAFLHQIPVHVYSGERRVLQTYTQDFSYEPNLREVEAIVAVFQHLAACRLTEEEDRAAIKQEMVTFLNGRKLSPFGRLLAAASRHGEISFVALDRQTLAAHSCRLYFEEPTWIRLKALEPSVQHRRLGLPSPNCIFALPRTAWPSASTPLDVTLAIEMVFDGVDDHGSFYKGFQDSSDWRRFVVHPLSMLQAEADPFPTIDHVMHTLLESGRQFCITEGGRHLYVLLCT
jgi:hypothetical protein